MGRSERMLRIALEHARIAKEEKVQAEPWKYFPKDRLITSSNCGEIVHISYHAQYAKAFLDYSLEELLELSCRELQVPHFPIYLPPEPPEFPISPRTIDEGDLTTNPPVHPVKPTYYGLSRRVGFNDILVSMKRLGISDLRPSEERKAVIVDAGQKKNPQYVHRTVAGGPFPDVTEDANQTSETVTIFTEDKRAAKTTVVFMLSNQLRTPFEHQMMTFLLSYQLRLLEQLYQEVDIRMIKFVTESWEVYKMQKFMETSNQVTFGTSPERACRRTLSILNSLKDPGDIFVDIIECGDTSDYDISHARRVNTLYERYAGITINYIDIMQHSRNYMSLGELLATELPYIRYGRVRHPEDIFIAVNELFPEANQLQNNLWTREDLNL